MGKEKKTMAKRLAWGIWTCISPCSVWAWGRQWTTGPFCLLWVFKDCWLAVVLPQSINNWIDEYLTWNSIILFQAVSWVSKSRLLLIATAPAFHCLLIFWPYSMKPEDSRFPAFSLEASTRALLCGTLSKWHWCLNTAKWSGFIRQQSSIPSFKVTPVS